MTRFDAVRILVRRYASRLPGRGYTRRSRLYRPSRDMTGAPGSPCIVRVGGHRMYVDPTRPRRRSGPDSSEATTKRTRNNLILSLIQPGMVVFEIWRQYGDYTLAFSRQCGPAGKVYAFEAFSEDLCRPGEEPGAERLSKHCPWCESGRLRNRGAGLSVRGCRLQRQQLLVLGRGPRPGPGASKSNPRRLDNLCPLQWDRQIPSS